MLSSRLLRRYRTLDAAERRRFREFAASPYHNKHRELRRFLRTLEDTAPDFAPAELDRKAFFGRLWPGRSFDMRPLADLMTYAVRLLEDFWAAERCRDERLANDLAVLEVLHHRDLNKDLGSKMRKVRRELEEDPLRDEMHYRNRYRLETVADAYFGKQATRKRDESLPARMDALDQWYLAEKLKGSCELLNRSRILQVEFDLYFVDALAAGIETNWDHYRDVPPVAIWSRVLAMLRQPTDDTAYEGLLRSLRKAGDRLPGGEMRLVYAYAQNHCIRRINAGDEGWLQQLLDLYREGLEAGFILDEEGHLPQSSYKNIVTTALRLGAFDWTRGFIDRYRDRIPASARENAHRYNLANWYYATGEPGRAMELLREVEFADVFYNLGAKTMLLKIYYEEEEFEPLQALVAAFRIYLKRNETISGDQARAYRNLVTLTQRLARVRQRVPYTSKSHTKRDLEGIGKKLSPTTPVMNIGWVRGKLGELREQIA